jgi:hypothetical protein
VVPCFSVLFLFHDLKCDLLFRAPNNQLKVMFLFICFVGDL